jgi:acetylglutamate kinase
VVDGRKPHSILLEIFTDEGIGTMVLPDITGSVPVPTPAPTDTPEENP